MVGSCHPQRRPPPDRRVLDAQARGNPNTWAWGGPQNTPDAAGSIAGRRALVKKGAATERSRHRSAEHLAPTRLAASRLAQGRPHRARTAPAALSLPKGALRSPDVHGGHGRRSGLAQVALCESPGRSISKSAVGRWRREAGSLRETVSRQQFTVAQELRRLSVRDDLAAVQDDRAPAEPADEAKVVAGEHLSCRKP